MEVDAQLRAGQPVALQQMLDAREQRLAWQQQLLLQFPMPLLSFTLNIAGPVKVFPLSQRAFEEGLALIHCQCKAHGFPIRHEEQRRQVTGYECCFSIEAAALDIKKVLVSLEDENALGRLFDLDVLDSGGEKISRVALGLPERGCLVCGKPGFACSRARTHTVEALLAVTCATIQTYFQRQTADQVAALAVRALLQEVRTTPKPGLVDQSNNGAHRDMDVGTFECSALALLPYFRRFVLCGMEGSACAETLLTALRPIGLEAECAMLRATGGVNTHKGILFSMGILCGALGLCHASGLPPCRETLTRLCRQIAAPLAADFQRITAQNAATNGEELYARHGMRGVRGEALSGFPTLFETALPRLQTLLAQGCSLNDAGSLTLLWILAVAQDTNVVTRSSYRRMEGIQEELCRLLGQNLPVAELLLVAEAMDRAFIAEHISPGGSADLLALAYFLHFLEQAGLLSPCQREG